MDAALAAAGLDQALAELLANRDFDGAETLLYDALTRAPAELRAEVHLALARVYAAWNKLTSAIDHVLRAAEGASDPGLRRRIEDQLTTLRRAQATQDPN